MDLEEDLTNYWDLTGCSIWGLTCDKHKEKMRKLQKWCMRIVTFSDFNSHTNPLFTDLKILKVDDVIKLNLLKFIYEFKHDLLPSEISNIFEYNTDIHNYNTRSTINQGLFIHVIVSTKYGTKSIKYQGPLLWNDLSKIIPSINEAHTLTSFKNIIKKHFLPVYNTV